MEPLLDISKSHFCTKDIHQYHLSKDNIAALWIDYGNKIGVQFDNILVQMTIDRYCGSRIYHIEQAKSQPKEDIYRREFTSVELNTINYTAGYVIHKLLKKYSKGTKVTIVNCLMEMVEGGQLDLPSENESYHETVQLYQSKVNRGGLVAVSENVMKFFCNIEHFAMDFGQKLISSSEDKQPYDRSQAVTATMQDEDLLFDWACFTCQVNNDDARSLLEEIINIWFDLRLHSVAAMEVERHKQTQTKKVTSKGLRKTLSEPF